MDIYSNKTHSLGNSIFENNNINSTDYLIKFVTKSPYQNSRRKSTNIIFVEIENQNPPYNTCVFINTSSRIYTDRFICLAGKYYLFGEIKIFWLQFKKKCKFLNFHLLNQTVIL